MAKIFAGASAAFLGTAITTYMSEITVAPIRGAMLGAFSFSFALGQFFNAIGLQIINQVGLGVSGEIQWIWNVMLTRTFSQTAPLKYRNAFYSEFVIFGIFLIVQLFLPESPGVYQEDVVALSRLVVLSP